VFYIAVTGGVHRLTHVLGLEDILVETVLMGAPVLLQATVMH